MNSKTVFFENLFFLSVQRIRNILKNLGANPDPRNQLKELPDIMLVFNRFLPELDKKNKFEKLCL